MEAIYARQSLDKKDSLSMEGQVEKCMQNVCGDYQVYWDKGFSGKNTRRPDFEKLMQDVTDGKISKIHVYKIDRFSRSIADFGQLMDKLEAHHVKFESVTEKFDTSNAMGRAMLSIVMVFAQLERETTADRVRDNYYQRFELGAWPGGPPPLGFDLDKTTDGAGRILSTLVLNESAELVEQIFQLYEQPETSLGSIAKKLNEQGIPCMKRKAWDNVALSRILHNPLYVMADEEVYWFYQEQGISCKQEVEAFQGTFACHVVGRRNRDKGKTPDKRRLALANHVGIISSKQWLACQHKLARNRQISQVNVGKHTWLSGLMKCGCCGYSIKVNLCEERRYLLCSGRSNYGVCTEKITAELSALEEIVANALTKLLAQCPPEEVPVADTVSAEIEEIDRKIERLVYAVASGSEAAVVHLNRMIAQLERERSQLQNQRKKVKPEKYALREIVFSELSFEEKKMVARRFIHKISLTEEEAEIQWSF